MAELIKPAEIAGGAVYGVRQMSYAVDGVSGKDYGAALAAAAFKESVAIEASASAYSEVVRQREKKIGDLGDVLAVLSKAIATMNPKSNDTGKKSDADNALITAKITCASYGVTLSLSDGNKITFKNAQTVHHEARQRLLDGRKDHRQVQQRRVEHDRQHRRLM